MKNSTITLGKEEYEDMKDLMERMRETIEVTSHKPTLKKLEAALRRMEKGDFLTEDQIRH